MTSKASGRWTEKEDERLRSAVLAFKDNNWNAISRHVGTRDYRQRWHKVLVPHFIKGNWSTTEDEQLRNVIAWQPTISKIDWDVIASSILGRDSNQAKERWLNYLDPIINKEPFTTEEIKVLEREFARLKNQWQKIVDALPAGTYKRAG
ncbi:myb-like DNA-binding protein [Thraustotheca clavata]|uniref:Myb-like DNA-binding protein n=1 Tax=Thraustotheca clavata TaxID=74557 RepID=A0A1V9Z2F7_9STRA|nr:myb-like DNA-binding protein [Thraustotheca clavata]